MTNPTPFTPTRWMARCLAIALLLGCGAVQARPEACPPPAKLKAVPAPVASTRPNGATISLYDLKTVRVHAYTAPAQAMRTSTYVIEGPSRLVIIEPQFLKSLSVDFRAYVETLGKPIDRVLVTDHDPDHYFGLASGFEDVPAYALKKTLALIKKSGPTLLEERRQIFGEEMPDHLVTPTRVLRVGQKIIDCVKYRFDARVDDEGNHQATIRLPDYGVIATGDIASNQCHIVPGKATEQRLRAFAKAAKSYRLVLPSNGVPADGGLFAEDLEYLKAVAANLKEAKTEDEYEKRMKRAYPNYACDIYFKFYVPAYYAK